MPTQARLPALAPALPAAWNASGTQLVRAVLGLKAKGTLYTWKHLRLTDGSKGRLGQYFFLLPCCFSGLTAQSFQERLLTLKVYSWFASRCGPLLTS